MCIVYSDLVPISPIFPQTFASISTALVLVTTGAIVIVAVVVVLLAVVVAAVEVVVKVVVAAVVVYKYCLFGQLIIP
jgi:hypothetical protein